MSDRAAEPSEDGAIPLIDLGPLCDGSGALGVAQALHRASREVGFLYVCNHGIDEAILEQARSEALAFFRSGDTQKHQIRITAAHRGWLGRGAAKMQDDARPDLKESFLWGHEGDGGDAAPDDHPLRGANRWPAFQPALRDKAMAFFEAAEGLAEQLMRGFALGLGKPAGFFLRSNARPLSRGSFVYYPPQSERAGAEQFGVAPHTDFGVLTILAQDDVGGLQVCDTADRWIDAPPIPGSLVINVGDLLARWTNDEYRSTPHRVVNRSGRERLSLVLAYDPEPQTLIDPREVFGKDVETDYEPITCGDYLTWRFSKAFAYRKER